MVNESNNSITKDNWDMVRFKLVRTDALKVVIQLPEDHASGLYEIIVE